jgi:hypothetical protein
MSIQSRQQTGHAIDGFSGFSASRVSQRVSLMFGGAEEPMKECSQCGKALSFWQGLGSSICPDCRAEADRLQAEAAQAEAATRARREHEAAERRYAAATRGEASAEDLSQLEAEGLRAAGLSAVRSAVMTGFRSSGRC